MEEGNRNLLFTLMHGEYIDPDIMKKASRFSLGKVFEDRHVYFMSLSTRGGIGLANIYILLLRLISIGGIGFLHELMMFFYHKEDTPEKTLIFMESPEFKVIYQHSFLIYIFVVMYYHMSFSHFGSIAHENIRVYTKTSAVPNIRLSSSPSEAITPFIQTVNNVNDICSNRDYTKDGSYIYMDVYEDALKIFSDSLPSYVDDLKDDIIPQNLSKDFKSVFHYKDNIKEEGCLSYLNRKDITNTYMNSLLDYNLKLGTYDNQDSDNVLMYRGPIQDMLLSTYLLDYAKKLTNKGPLYIILGACKVVPVEHRAEIDSSYVNPFTTQFIKGITTQTVRQESESLFRDQSKYETMRKRIQDGKKPIDTTYSSYYTPETVRTNTLKRRILPRRRNTMTYLSLDYDDMRSLPYIEWKIKNRLKPFVGEWEPQEGKQYIVFFNKVKGATVTPRMFFETVKYIENNRSVYAITNMIFFGKDPDHKYHIEGLKMWLDDIERTNATAKVYVNPLIYKEEGIIKLVELFKQSGLLFMGQIEGEQPVYLFSTPQQSIASSSIQTQRRIPSTRQSSFPRLYREEEGYVWPKKSN